MFHDRLLTTQNSTITTHTSIAEVNLRAWTQTPQRLQVHNTSGDTDVDRATPALLSEQSNPAVVPLERLTNSASGTHGSEVCTGTTADSSISSGF
jgi:hypothetical protein